MVGPRICDFLSALEKKLQLTSSESVSKINRDDNFCEGKYTIFGYGKRNPRLKVEVISSTGNVQSKEFQAYFRLSF